MEEQIKVKAQYNLKINSLDFEYLLGELKITNTSCMSTIYFNESETIALRSFIFNVMNTEKKFNGNNIS